MATASVVPSGGTTSLLLEREVQVAALRALITTGLIQAYPRRVLLADRPPPRRQESQRRHRPLHPRDHLAPAVRTRRPLHRPRRRVLQQPHRPWPPPT